MHKTTLGEKVRSHITELIPIFNLNPHSERILRVYEMLTRESLALDINAPIPKFSTINDDGVPFEFSVSVGGSNGGLRILTEIGVPGTSLPNRINMTILRLNDVLSYLELQNAAVQINSAFSTLFPDNSRDLIGWRGGAWIAAGFMTDGRINLRIYINAADGDVNDRWLRLGKMLSRLDRFNASEKLCALSPLVSTAAAPLGIAFDILPDGLGRVKFYLRTYKYSHSFLDSVLAEVGLSKFRGLWHDFSEILLVEKQTYPDQAIVLSLEFPREDDAEIDLKIDACAHCLFNNDQTARHACLEIAQRWSMDITPYENMLEELSGTHLSEKELRHHAFFGIGFSHLKNYRFNIYLKPAVAAYLKDGQTGFYPIETFCIPHSHSKSLYMHDEEEFLDDLKRSFKSAAEYIIKHQSQSGQWIDFVLPVGSSDAWVTAYVGLALVNLSKELVTKKVEKAVENACSWSIRAMQPDFGWGYNAFTESDADSSAQIVLFLSACNHRLPDGCFEFLQSHQKQDGGFATYNRPNPNNSWGYSHPDVTPIVLNALLTNKAINTGLLVSASKYIESNQNSDGIWRSYWWDSYLYSTWANINLLMKNGLPYDSQKCLDFLTRQPLPKDAFSLSLLGGCLFLLRSHFGDPNPEPLAILRKIIQLQSVDGSWYSSRILRLTDEKLKEPWDYPYAGELFTDYRNLFTTATVLRCLTPVINHFEHKKKY